MFRRIAILIIASACLAGCTMAPSFGRPESPVSATWPTGPSYKDATGKPADKVVADIPWQEFFVDPQLQQLIGLALANTQFESSVGCEPSHATRRTHESDCS
jgi:outer membrane protein, multidrug efflux system